MSRRKCSVCGLFRGKVPHSGALHDRIRANQRRVKARATGRSSLGRFVRRAAG